MSGTFFLLLNRLLFIGLLLLALYLKTRLSAQMFQLFSLILVYATLA